MSDFITAITSFFTFIWAQLSNFAEFFTETTLGQIILAVSLSGVIVSLVTYIINRLRG